MRKIHYYFFCLYNLFYKDGFGLWEKKSYKALSLEQRPIFLLCINAWFWTLLVRLFIIVLFQPAYTILPIKHYELLIPLTAYAVYYFYFINNSRYINIYAQYRLTNKDTQRRDSRKVIAFLILPLALFILCALMLTYLMNINLHMLINQTKP